MSKENNVEYERVDEKGDKYKRILVKFNTKFLRGSDFEIEFILLEKAFDLGQIFISEIDSISTIDLYRWFTRHDCLVRGGGGDELGTILSKKDNMRRAKMLTDAHHQRGAPIEPRQVISRIKREFEGIAEEFNEPISYIYNYFLFSGQLGSLPFANADFTLSQLKYAIEEIDYDGFSDKGMGVRRALVPHLFDTHKTEFVRGNICLFLRMMQYITKKAMEKKKEKQQQ